MNCKEFSEGIDGFKSRPILYNKLIEQHKREHPDCVCKITRLSI